MIIKTATLIQDRLLGEFLVATLIPNHLLGVVVMNVDWKQGQPSMDIRIYVNDVGETIIRLGHGSQSKLLRFTAGSFNYASADKVVLLVKEMLDVS